MRGFFGSKALGLVFSAAYLAGDTCPLRVPDAVWPRLPPRISLKTQWPSASHLQKALIGLPPRDRIHND